jgi:hypothetical protein
MQLYGDKSIKGDLIQLTAQIKCDLERDTGHSHGGPEWRMSELKPTYPAPYRRKRQSPMAAIARRARSGRAAGPRPRRRGGW